MMAKEADTRIHWKNNYGYIYLPEKIVLDSAFPFMRDRREVKIRIKGKSLVITKD